MVSALIANPFVREIDVDLSHSFLIRASTSSRLFRTTKNGEPAMTPSRFGRLTLIPDAAANRFHPLEAVLDRISHGPGFQQGSYLGHQTTSPCVATAISIPDKRGSRRTRINIERCPRAPRSSLTSSTVPAPGPSTENLELIAHVALGKPDHHEQQVRVSLHRYERSPGLLQDSLEVRNPVKPVRGKSPARTISPQSRRFCFDIGLTRCSALRTLKGTTVLVTRQPWIRSTRSRRLDKRRAASSAGSGGLDGLRLEPLVDINDKNRQYRQAPRPGTKGL